MGERVLSHCATSTHPVLQSRWRGFCQPWASRQYQLDPDYQSLNWPIAAERLKLSPPFAWLRLLDWALSTGPE